MPDDGDPNTSHNITRLLVQLRSGNREVADQLVPLIYSELRRIAGAQMARERRDHTLQATAVVHEAYMRLVGEQEAQWQNRAHFFAIAAKTMRQVLLDYARRHRAGKRGGAAARKVDFNIGLLVGLNTVVDVIAINEALERLEQIDPRQCRLVELRFFAGLDVDQAAEVMGISPTTIKREWRSAKAWLKRELTAAERG